MAHEQPIRRRYDRISRLYDLLEAPMERLFQRRRRELLSQARGEVLEVGVGTGKNLAFYPPEARVTAVDFSAGMLAQARRRAQRLGLDKVRLLQMDVEDLDFADRAFDCVVSTCVFCSVPDPVRGLSEIRRVLRPGGRVLMLEHVRSERRVLGSLMDWLNPLPLHLYGANINRRTVENLRRAGFEAIEVQDLWLDVFKRIDIGGAGTGGSAD